MQSQIKGRVAHSHSFFLHSFFLAVAVAAKGLGADPQKVSCLCKLMTAPHKGTTTTQKVANIRKHIRTHASASRLPCTPSHMSEPHTHTHTYTHTDTHTHTQAKAQHAKAAGDMQTCLLARK
jgi:hypothetical protein